MKKIILTLVAVAATALLLSGCFRKHIESSPPAKQPARTVETGSQPGIIEETHVVGASPADEQPLSGPMEESYEVNAPKEAGARPTVMGEDLASEPLPNDDQLRKEAEAAATESAEATPEPAMKATPDPEAEQVMDAADTPGADAPAMAAGGRYYVQVGAFSDLENANRTLARLRSDGYKDSVLTKTDEGLFRVQAGSFPDEASAENALSILRADYPKGFVLKKP